MEIEKEGKANVPFEDFVVGIANGSSSSSSINGWNGMVQIMAKLCLHAYTSVMWRKKDENFEEESEREAANGKKEMYLYDHNAKMVDPHRRTRLIVSVVGLQFFLGLSACAKSDE